MKTIKQLREQQVIAKLQNSDDKIQRLVNEGLLDESKITLLKRALKKEDAKLSNAEYRVLKEAFDMLASQQLDESAWKGLDADKYTKYDDRFGQDTKSPYKRLSGYSTSNAPMILVLKRKAIRVFPDNVKVAVYYSKELDKYISVPFNEIGLSETTEAGKDAADERLKRLRKLHWNKVKDEDSLSYKSKKYDNDIIKAKAKNQSGSAAEKLAWKAGAKLGQWVHRNRYKKDNETNTEKNGSLASRIADRVFKSKRQDLTTAARHQVHKAGINPDTVKYSGYEDKKGNKLSEDFDAFKQRIEETKAAIEEGIVDTIANRAKEYGSGLAKKAMKGVGAAAGGVAMGLAAAGAGQTPMYRKDDDENNEKKSAAKEKPSNTDDSTDNEDENVRNPQARSNEIKKAKDDKKVAKAVAAQTKMNENILEKLQTINEETMIHYPDKSVMVNKALADKILETYNHLNTKNKRIVEQMLQTDSKSFRKMVNFISRYQ